MPDNGEDSTTSNVLNTYSPNGWLVNDVHYDNDAQITITSDTTILPDYTQELIPATFPSDPEKQNNQFLGWFYEDTPYTEYSDSQNITLTAHWTLISHTVTFVDSDGETVLSSAQYDYGTPAANILTPNVPNKENLSFDGWEPELAPVTQNQTYTAKWVPVL